MAVVVAAPVGAASAGAASTLPRSVSAHQSVVSGPLAAQDRSERRDTERSRRQEPDEADVPCPRAGSPSTAIRPERPSVLPDEPELRRIGGPALDTSGLAVPDDVPDPPALSAVTWLVADLDTGEVLGACGAHELGAPASVQKLLLSAVAMESLDPDDVITVNRADLDIEPGSSAVGLLVGGEYPVSTLWLGLILNSGNEAANVLARVAGGRAGVAGTLRAMNDEARRLGAYQTNAVTPHGLDDPDQVTTVYDLALIARACFENADFVRYARTERTRIPAQPPEDPQGFEIQNQNQLVFDYEGALGGKTGYTDQARHTYVGAAERDGRRLVVTLLGAEARPLRGWEQGATLLDWGFSLPEDASVGRLVDPGEVPLPGSEPEADEPDDTPRAPAAATVATGPVVSAADTMIAVFLLLLMVVPLVLLITRVRRRSTRRRRVVFDDD